MDARETATNSLKRVVGARQHCEIREAYSKKSGEPARRNRGSLPEEIGGACSKKSWSPTPTESRRASRESSSVPLAAWGAATAGRAQ